MENSIFPKEFFEDVVDYNATFNVIPLGYSCWNNLFEIRNIPFNLLEFRWG